jgi:hypothetical protein
MTAVELEDFGVELGRVGVACATCETDESRFVGAGGGASALCGVGAVLVLEEIGVDGGQANDTRGVRGDCVQGGFAGLGGSEIGEHLDGARLQAGGVVEMGGAEAAALLQGRQGNDLVAGQVDEADEMVGGVRAPELAEDGEQKLVRTEVCDRKGEEAADEGGVGGVVAAGAGDGVADALGLGEGDGGDPLDELIDGVGGELLRRR